MKTIVLNDLKLLCSRMLTQAAQLSGGSVNYHFDFYWTISLWSAYDFQLTQEEYSTRSLGKYSMGSLVDDWQSLELILHKKNNSTFIDLERLGDVIAFLGNELFRPEEEKKGWHFTVQVADVLRICMHLLTKVEHVGIDELDITIDLYSKFFLKDAEDSYQGLPPETSGSFVEDWQQLQQLDQNAQCVAADFERLGRTIKVIGQTLFQEQRAHTDLGRSFLCSQFDIIDDEDDVEGE